MNDGLYWRSALCGPLAAWAHHSVAFYSNDKIELAGEITKIDWQNPHIQFQLRAVGSDGTEKTWQLESSSIFLREKDGVTRDLFRVGDDVKVFGRPSAHDASALLVTNMLLPDGREAPMWPNTTAHFVGADQWISAKAQLVDAAAENRGIFRVWRPNEVSLATLPYTAEAVAARKSFDLLAAATRCRPEGMPRIMITLFPYEFVDRGNEIMLRAEIYDTERTIHMDRTEPPPGEPHSVLGYSVGEWRDGALVIRTSLVNWPYFDQIGTPLTDNGDRHGALQSERGSKPARRRDHRRRSHHVQRAGGRQELVARLRRHDLALRLPGEIGTPFT